MDVARIAARGVDGKEDERFFEDLRDAVDCVLLEDNELAGADFDRWLVTEKKERSAGEDK